MKIMHVEAGKNLYGGALQVFYLMRDLVSHGVENILVCPIGSEIAKASENVARVEQCKMGGDVDFLFRYRLIKLIKKHRPDVVHVHSRRGADFWGCSAAKACKVPAILTRRVDNRDSPFLLRFKQKRYKKIIAISEGIRQVLIAQGVDPDQTQTIRSVVDHQKFTPLRARDGFNSRFNYKDSDIVIAVVAQLIERKGHRFLFDIAHELLAVNSKLKIMILGKGALESQLRERTCELGLEFIVKFVGFQKDIENILPNVDVVAHPALMEGLGVALLQASACAVPVVAAASGGIPEIVRDNVNGKLVTPGDSRALFDALKPVLEDEILRKKYGLAGRKLIEDEFSIEAMTKQYLELYATLIN